MTRTGRRIGLLIFLAACGGSAARVAPQADEVSAALKASGATQFDEALYNVHSVRTSRVNGCTRPGWPPAGVTVLASFEDNWDLYSYRTRASDGRVVETMSTSVGTSTGCFGLISLSEKTGRVLFDGELHFGDVNVRASGLCDSFRNTPVTGMATWGCNWALSGDGFAGGHLAATSANPDAKPVPDADAFDPDPVGVHESGFMTIRLWK